MVSSFFHTLLHYCIEVIPSLFLGFFLSGIIYKLVPQDMIDRHLTGKGIKPILYTTIFGAFLPICCVGSLPVAVGFRKKGVSLGPILAFLVATPATSISAVLVMWRMMGLGFTLYMCAAVILMGLVSGLIGNLLPHQPAKLPVEHCPACGEKKIDHCCHGKETFFQKIIDGLHFGFIELPKEIGWEIFLGLLLAAFVASFSPVGEFIKSYLSGSWGYVFSLIFGLFTYICSTASVPFVHAFMSQGLSVGAGVVLLLVGPISSYGTILVLKKEFGWRVLAVYLTVISVMSIFFGLFYSYLFHGKILN